MSTSGPSDAAVEAAARQITWAHQTPDHAKSRRQASVVLIAAYEVDEPRIRAEARAEMRDEIVAFIHREFPGGEMDYDAGEDPSRIADAIAAKFADPHP